MLSVLNFDSRIPDSFVSALPKSPNLVRAIKIFDLLVAFYADFHMMGFT